MAMMKVYATYDKDAEKYNSHTFMAENNKMAIRIVEDAALSKGNENFLRSIEKFELYKLAKYDDENGEMIPEKELVGNLKDICNLSSSMSED